MALLKYDAPIYSIHAELKQINGNTELDSALIISVANCILPVPRLKCCDETLSAVPSIRTKPNWTLSM